MAVNIRNSKSTLISVVSEAKHLLMPADNSDLGRGRMRGADQIEILDAARDQFFRKRLSVMIISDEAGDRRCATEQREIMSDICRTAELIFRLEHMSDRHGSLGRNASSSIKLTTMRSSLSTANICSTARRRRCTRACRTRRKP